MRKRLLSLLMMCVVGLTISAPPAPAAAGVVPYELTWVTVDGGGGRSAGGSYALTLTLGQPDAWNQQCGRYHLSGGFWSHLAPAGACQHYLPFIKR